MADQVDLNAFISRSAEAFCYDDAIRFARHDGRLEIELINPALRATCLRDGRKLDRLDFYWLCRRRDARAASIFSPIHASNRKAAPFLNLFKVEKMRHAQMANGKRGTVLGKVAVGV